MTKKRVNKGYITDYISGGSILNTVKELKTTQLLSKLLVEDYHYPKEWIRTYPQFKVKGRSEKSYRRCPVDLVIFNDITQNDDSINTIVLCNRRSAKKEEEQLKLFLRFSKADFGIYYEKNSFHFIRKKCDNGFISFKTISNLPMYGQTAEEVGIIKRGQLKSTSNLKTIMECIINYLLRRKTKDLESSVLAEQLMNIIICKLFDERYTHLDDFVSFYTEIEEDDAVVKQRIDHLFKQVKLNYHDIFDSNDSILLDAENLRYVVGQLQNFSIMECFLDSINETFELLYDISGCISPQKNPEISKNLINTIVELINPQLNETVLDPFCKEGDLLRASLQHLHEKVDHYSQKCGWSDVFIQDKKLMIECTEIFGIERNSIVAKAAKAKMIINQNGREKIYCDHILNSRNHWKFDTVQEVNFGKYDIVISVASFLPNEESNDEALLRQYESGYVWRKKGDIYTKTNKLKKKEKLQILFIEQCLKLVKKHGRMGLILPEAIFYAPQYNYLWYYILQNNNLQYTLNLGKFNISQHNRNKYGAIIIEKNGVQGDTQNHFVE